MLAILILTTSIVFQLAAAYLALRLIRITGRRTGWTMIAAAVFLMALRRCITLFGFLFGNGMPAPDPLTEWVALIISVLMLVGIGAISRLFSSIKRSEESFKQSEEKYRTLVEQASDGILIADPSGNYLDANDSACRMLGYTRNEILRLNIRSIVAFKGRSHVPQAILHLKDGREWIDEWMLERKDGTTFSAEISMKGLSDGRLLGVVRDITERKRTGEALRESQRTLATLMSSLPGAAYRCRNDKNWTLEFISEGSHSLTGYFPSDFTEGKISFGQLIHPDDQKAVWNDVQTALQGKRPYQLTYRIRTLLEEEKWVWEKGQGIFSPAGELLFLEGFVTDITERKRAEESLQEREERLRAIIENEPECIKLVDRAGNLLDMNPAGLRMIEADSLEQVEGQCIFRLAVVEHREAFEQLHKRVLQGESGSLVFDIITLKGARRTLETHETLLRDASGRVVAVIGITRDITERKRAEEALVQAEARLRLALQAGRIGTWDWNMATGQIIWSQGHEELWGMAPGAFKGTYAEFDARLHPEDRDGLQTAVEEALAQRRTYCHEFRVIWPDGSLHWMAGQGEPLFDSADQPVRMIGVVQDITERKRAEEALRESQASLEAAQERARLGSWEIDVSAQRGFWSREMFRLFDRDPTLGPPTFEEFIEFVHPEDRQILLATHARIIENNETAIFDFRTNPDRGAVKHFRATVDGIADAAGHVVRLAGTILDVTERKEAEEAIRRLNQDLERRVAERTAQLEAVNKEIESFSYSVSHDLRAPLRAMGGFSRVLLARYSDRLDPQGRDFLQRVDAASQRMAALIEDLLNLSRITRRVMRKAPLDLTALARSIAEELQAADPKRRVTFLIQDRMKAEGDRGLLRIALENLLGNAWKFTSKRPKAIIEFGRVEQEGKPTYFVRDNGAGFDMAYADKLFGAFQRLHSMSEFEGTGIGLATVQRIIHRHGGEVWAEAEVEKGATFYFTL
ncbi:MAG: PAS domain S-box protein [Candidatus Manganitrophus sp. SB1]|nr:PAS domain S-box protein [Candidatus Manganitrophus morganii]